tara:strand:+ start:180 stop:890 length:711 start_codon:yes stop_codon:yes gene_type:complete
MKKITLILICTFLSVALNAQSFIGAWETNYTSQNGDQLKSVIIFGDGYQVTATYDLQTGKFIRTEGGTWQLTGDTMTQIVEFDSKHPEEVGKKVSYNVFINDSIMGIVGSGREYKRIDNGEPGKLDGAWLMSGRVRDGKEQMRDTSGPRKTMKILSGTRFQWIAYNTETKEFMGTGGGTYTTENGKYTENIEFFSRDDSRVGMTLIFDYNLVDGNWHHSGLSSKGDPIHEIWSKRE